MVNYFIYAKDFSGSTGGDVHFHSNAIKTLDQFKSDVEHIQAELQAGGKQEESKIIYLHWGDECFEVDEEITVLSYNELECGDMGTEPETIIKWIIQNYHSDEPIKIKLLYIITDGMIDQGSVSECFRLNSMAHYETFVFHAFNTDLESIDLSVAASFFKDRCKVYRNNELFDNINVGEELDYDRINIKNFTVEKENMKSYIKLKFINTSKHDAVALKEIDKLKKLRARLFDELSSKTEKTASNLDTKDRDVFLSEFVNTEWYKSLNTPSQGWKVEIEKSISTLINYIVSDTKSYSFDALKFDQTFDTPVEEEPIVDVNFKPEQEIEFPDIILADDKGIPVILLTKFNLLEKIIFHKTIEEVEEPVSPASFNKFKSTMECPLFLMNDSDVSESIGYFYTLNVYKELLASRHKTEPRTRRPFHGGLVLIDTDDFDKYNDYILSATYFDSKKVNYNIGLFYYVLWKNSENKEWMDRNVVEQFRKYVVRRVSKAVCRIGLSSLPLDPPVNTLLPTALWYCVELSSRIFKNDAQHFVHERLRMHYGVARYMIEILNYLDYDLDLDFIDKRRDLIRHVMTLKKIPTRGEKVYFLLEKIFKTENGFLVSEIQKPFNLNKLNYLKLNHKGLLSDDVLKEKVHLNDYVHLMHFEDGLSKSKDGRALFEICEKTYRPYFTVGENKSFYTELLKVTKQVVISNDGDNDNIKITYEAIDSLEFVKMLSYFNLFLKCVKDTQKYPTFPEFIEYISKKNKFNGDLVTIFPTNVLVNAGIVYTRYRNVATEVEVCKFLEVCKKYVNRFDRVKAEEVMKFDNNSEILEFISREEEKVNLKKNTKVVKESNTQQHGRGRGACAPPARSAIFPSNRPRPVGNAARCGRGRARPAAPRARAARPRGAPGGPGASPSV